MSRFGRSSPLSGDADSPRCARRFSSHEPTGPTLRLPPASATAAEPGSLSASAATGPAASTPVDLLRRELAAGQPRPRTCPERECQRRPGWPRRRSLAGQLQQLLVQGERRLGRASARCVGCRRGRGGSFPSRELGAPWRARRSYPPGGRSLARPRPLARPTAGRSLTPLPGVLRYERGRAGWPTLLPLRRWRTALWSPSGRLRRRTRPERWSRASCLRRRRGP
jgi:hypothetical protein